MFAEAWILLVFCRRLMACKTLGYELAPGHTLNLKARHFYFLTFRLPAEEIAE